MTLSRAQRSLASTSFVFQFSLELSNQFEFVRINSKQGSLQCRYYSLKKNSKVQSSSATIHYCQNLINCCEDTLSSSSMTAHVSKSLLILLTLSFLSLTRFCITPLKYSDQLSY